MLRVKFAAMTALAIGFSACSTVQENPNYQYSSKYQGSAPIVHNGVSQSAVGYSSAASSQVQAQTQTYQAPTYQTSSYNQAGQYSAAQQDCRRRENRRELIGGAAGGTIGAIAGKKIIGGTAGTIAGAAIGGTAGYGLGARWVGFHSLWCCVLGFQWATPFFLFAEAADC